MELEAILSVIFAGGIAGFTAMILRAKQRQGIKGRKMKTWNAVRYYFTEFLVGFLAGILLSVFAEPVNIKQVVMFGIAAEANAEYVIELISKKLIHYKEDELDSVKEQSQGRITREDEKQ